MRKSSKNKAMAFTLHDRNIQVFCKWEMIPHAYIFSLMFQWFYRYLAISSSSPSKLNYENVNKHAVAAPGVRRKGSPRDEWRQLCQAGVATSQTRSRQSASSSLALTQSDRRSVDVSSDVVLIKAWYLNIYTLNVLRVYSQNASGVLRTHRWQNTRWKTVRSDTDESVFQEQRTLTRGFIPGVAVYLAATKLTLNPHSSRWP